MLNLEDKTVKLKYTDATMTRLTQKGNGKLCMHVSVLCIMCCVLSQLAKTSNPGKFSLELNEQPTEDNQPLEVQQEVELTVGELIEPKLVT